MYLDSVKILFHPLGMASTRSRKRYHHGNLRAALLLAAARLAARDGVEGLSLRRVARQAGVSHSAPYHHFPDKAALLSALAQESYRGLAAEMENALQGVAAPLARLEAVGQAYIRYAVKHPNYFRVMFRPELVTPDSFRGQPAAAHAFEQLVGAVRDHLLQVGRDGEDPYPLAVVAWATVHGIAALWIDGPLSDGAFDVERFGRLATQAIVAALESGLPSPDSHSLTRSRRRRRPK